MMPRRILALILPACLWLSVCRGAATGLRPFEENGFWGFRAEGAREAAIPARYAAVIPFSPGGIAFGAADDISSSPS